MAHTIIKRGKDIYRVEHPDFVKVHEDLKGNFTLRHIGEKEEIAKLKIENKKLREIIDQHIEEYK